MASLVSSTGMSKGIMYSVMYGVRLIWEVRNRQVRKIWMVGIVAIVYIFIIICEGKGMRRGWGVNGVLNDCDDGFACYLVSIF